MATPQMRTLSKSDLLFLVAMSEKGLTFMNYYGEPGAKKAQERLAHIKRETSQQATS